MMLAFFSFCLTIALITAWVSHDARNDMDDAGKLLMNDIDDEEIRYSSVFLILGYALFVISSTLKVIDQFYNKFGAYSILSTIAMILAGILLISYYLLFYLLKIKRYLQFGLPKKIRIIHIWIGVFHIGILLTIFILLAFNLWK
jgi:hypothetical protein